MRQTSGTAQNPQARDHAWWSNRGAARVGNAGWRVNCRFLTLSLRGRLQVCSIYTGSRFSDRAPFTTEYAG
jgi:exodeoxyribonuclease-3